MCQAKYGTDTLNRQGFIDSPGYWTKNYGRFLYYIWFFFPGLSNLLNKLRPVNRIILVLDAKNYFVPYLSCVCVLAFTKKGLRFLLGMSKTLICSQGEHTII